MSTTVGWLWWGLMVSISVLNLVLLCGVLLRRSPADVSGDGESKLPTARAQRVLRACAVIFTAVAAYRSVLPRIDVPRICFFDTPLNWVIFGRSAATVAEVAWSVQMGVVLSTLGAQLHSSGKVSQRAAQRALYGGRAVVCMACIAECNSWTNLVSENNVFAVVEQSLWSLLFLTTGAGIGCLLRFW